MNHKSRVLFFSIGDSTRSQIAEGFLRSFAGDEFVAMSTATRSLEADPLAREVMREVGIDISGQHAKNIASREKFPLWPFTCNILHWSVLDPEQAEGTTERKRQVFRRVRDEINRRVREFLDELHGNHWSARRAAG